MRRRSTACWSRTGRSPRATRGTIRRWCSAATACAGSIRGGPPLGLFDAIPFQEETVSLEPGDWVIVFSDGVSEALSAAGEEFGDARIAEVARAHYDHEPTVLLEALLSSVRTFATGAPQSDDVTALVVRYRGPSNGGRALTARHHPRR